MFWVGLAVGIFLGAPIGLMLCALFTSSRVTELEDELTRSRSLEEWVHRE